MKGKTIGIVSIKGGVGKTTVVANLATAFANEFGKKVLAVDANFTAPNLGIHLGVVNQEHTLHEVLKGKVDVSKAIYPVNLGFDLMPASLLAPAVDPFRLKRKLQPLKSEYDVIIIDSSPNLNDEILATMIASDELLVVTSPDYPTLSCTMHAIKVAKKKNVPISGLILNRARDRKYELSLQEVEEATEVPVIGWLPEDEKVIEALSETIPAVAFAPKRDVAVEYKKLASCLVGEDYKDKRVWNKVKGFFVVNDISKVEVNREVLRKR
ncbi:AAA family ATPase [Candidatus Woesearchaeota archaeon]|nr:AAA family ATPase [Candidatus Woesearchaeota archaeon]